MFATMLKSLVCAFLFAIPSSTALPWEGPEPTAAAFNDFRDMGVSRPMPSAPAALFAAYELKRRQTSAALTTSSSSFIHATCGFRTGDPDNALTCISSGYKCAVDTSRSAFGCCTDIANCGILTSCIPQASLSSCGSDCQRDNFLAKCGPTYPFCNQNVLVVAGGSSMTNWYCDNSPTIVTYRAQPTSGSLSANLAFMTLSISALTTSTSSSSTSSPTSSTTSVVQSIVTVTPTPSPTPDPTPGKKTPIGAIVGGVVGGIALIIAAIVACICIKRKKKHNSPAPVEVPVGHAGPGYGPVPGQTAEPGVGGFYQPAIAEKEAAPPTGQNQQRRAEMYSPPHSPAPQYTPTYPAGHQPSHQLPQQQPKHVYPNVAEMGSGEISAHAAPGSY